MTISLNIHWAFRKQHKLRKMKEKHVKAEVTSCAAMKAIVLP